MNTQLRSTKWFGAMASILVVIVVLMNLQGASASDDTAPVVVIWQGGTGTETPTVTATASVTPSATATETATATATSTSDTGGNSSTVPAVSALPETGSAHHQSHATGTLLAMLAAGALIMFGGFVSSQRSAPR